MIAASHELIDRYAAGGPLLAYALTGLAAEHYKARPGPGVWSLGELVTHLVDSDVVGSDRMKRVIAEPGPILLAYDQDAWIARLGGDDLDPAEAVALFAANRRWTTSILRRVDEADFARFGDHTERGRETLAHLITGYVRHLDDHLRFLYAKRANLGIATVPRYSADSITLRMPTP